MEVFCRIILQKFKQFFSFAGITLPYQRGEFIYIRQKLLMLSVNGVYTNFKFFAPFKGAIQLAGTLMYPLSFKKVASFQVKLGRFILWSQYKSFFKEYTGFFNILKMIIGRCLFKFVFGRLFLQHQFMSIIFEYFIY